MSINQSTLRGLNPGSKTRIQITNTVLAAASQTLQMEQLLHYLLSITSAVPVTLTLPTVTEITNHYVFNNVQVADAIEFVVRNNGDGVVTMAVPAGSSTSGTMTIAASQYRRFLLRLDSRTSYTLLDAGAAQGPSANPTSVWQSTADSVTAVDSIQLDTSVPGVTFSDDFVFGSSSTEDTGLVANDVRMTFRKNTVAGAFRAGSATGTQWDVANTGTDSVAFGLNNIASGTRAAVTGGSGNSALGTDAFVGGGSGNSTNASEARSAIIGGLNNSITAGGQNNVIGGGSGNQIIGGGTVQQAFIGGGLNNTVSQPNAAILGGSGNTASGDRSFVGGGESNTASGLLAGLGGGDSNLSSNNSTFVGGGSNNTASGINAVVFGGTTNTASGQASSIPGGTGNTASGDNSFVCGTNASDGGFDNCFVFNDGTGNTAATANQQVVLNAAGEVIINNGAAAGVLSTVINTGSTLMGVPATQSATWAYVPGDGADWTDADPSNISDAIDRLARALTPVA